MEHGTYSSQTYHKLIGSKYVFQIKKKANGSLADGFLKMYKACLVTRG
jgi:hypothetical protein